MRGAATIWTGSAFDCLHTNNEIYVLESSTGGDTCNNGAIVANVISVEENNYISQLNVTVTSQTVGKTIRCLYDNGQLNFTHYATSVIHTTGLLPCKLC